LPIRGHLREDDASLADKKLICKFILSVYGETSP
jgi:hypothetical protein